MKYIRDIFQDIREKWIKSAKNSIYLRKNEYIRENQNISAFSPRHPQIIGIYNYFNFLVLYKYHI